MVFVLVLLWRYKKLFKFLSEVLKWQISNSLGSAAISKNVKGF